MDRKHHPVIKAPGGFPAKNLSRIVVAFFSATVRDITCPAVLFTGRAMLKGLGEVRVSDCAKPHLSCVADAVLSLLRRTNWLSFMRTRQPGSLEFLCLGAYSTYVGI